MAVYLAENWTKGKATWTRIYYKWVEDNYQDQGLASDLTDILEDNNLDGDGKLSAALISMNVNLPLFWKGDVVCQEWAVANPSMASDLENSSLASFYEIHRKNHDFDLKEILTNQRAKRSTAKISTSYSKRSHKKQSRNYRNRLCEFYFERWNHRRSEWK